MASKGDSAPTSGVLGAYIRAQRQMAELSLRQLGEMTSVSNAYLSQVERGLHQPSLKVLGSIASALNLSSETMLAQAGLIDRESSVAPSNQSVDAAIRADPALKEDEKQVLLGIYQNFRQRRE